MYSDSCLYKDTYVIINMMDKKMREKITPQFIKFLKENQDVEYKSCIDDKIPLKEQELSTELKLMLSIIYIDYLCDSDVKEKIMRKEKENIQEYNKKVTENIFIKINQNNTQKDKLNDTSLVVYQKQENIFIRIWEKIKVFFKK